MANYTTTITNEGAALLASVIANQGTLTFNEFRFSENDYTGQESTLTEGTFLGVFITASAAASVIDSTTIKASAQFNNSTITGNHDLYSIGIVGTDGNTTALIAVCTTTDPDVIREPLTGTSTYAFNVNLTVSDTSQITVVGTTAAVIYDTDVVDTLISTVTDKPLSANMGRVINENVEAIVDVYGAKNLAILDLGSIMSINTGGTWSGNVYSHRSVDFTVTDNGVSVSGTASGGAAFIDIPLSTLTNGDKYTANGISGGADETYQIKFLNGSLVVQSVSDLYDGERTFEKNSTNQNVEIYRIRVANGANVTTDIYPMIRDARITDPTFAPYAKTNQQLTADKAERNDLSTIHATGSTNTTGAQIDAGTFFYLNGQFCKALADIAVNATFTENTNYKKTNLGKELPNMPLTQIANAGTSYTIYRIEPYTYSSYCIRNGLVFVNVSVLCNSPEANWSKVCDLPRSNYLTTIDVGSATNHASPFDSIPLLLQNGELFAIGGTASAAYCTSFCYPI